MAKDIPFDVVSWGYTQIVNITRRKWNKILPQIEQTVAKESMRLFKYMLGQDGGKSIIDVNDNPYRGLFKGSWGDLSKKYKERKIRNQAKGKSRYTEFYGYKGNLERALNSALPGQIFGDPVVDFKSHRNKIGSTITIRPWGERSVKGTVLGSNLSPEGIIQKELFGVRADGITNEEDRPVVRPAQLHLLNYRIMRRVRTIIKKGMENDK